MLPTRCRDALQAIVYIALYSKGRAVNGSEVCAYMGLSSRGLESVLQMLVHHGILKGVTGPKGGYTLAKEKRKLSVADIVSLFWQEDVNVQESTELAKTLVDPLCEDLKSSMMLSLKHLTIDALVQEMEEHHADEAGDFSI